MFAIGFNEHKRLTEIMSRSGPCAKCNRSIIPAKARTVRAPNGQPAQVCDRCAIEIAGLGPVPLLRG